METIPTESVEKRQHCFQRLFFGPNSIKYVIYMPKLRPAEVLAEPVGRTVVDSPLKEEANSALLRLVAKPGCKEIGFRQISLTIYILYHR